MKESQRDPFDQVMHEAEALRESAMEELPSRLKEVLQIVMRETKARPLVAIMAAAFLGFLVALTA